MNELSQGLDGSSARRRLRPPGEVQRWCSADGCWARGVVAIAAVGVMAMRFSVLEDVGAAVGRGGRSRNRPEPEWQEETDS